jgi:hypothetical protein
MLYEEYCDLIKKLNKNNIDNNVFFTNIIPDLSIHDYVNRIIKYCLNNNEVEIQYKPWVLKCSYNIIQYMSDIINNNNIYNIIITTITISSKYILDEHYTNLFYSKVGGINLFILNKYEIKILEIIKWEIFIFS